MKDIEELMRPNIRRLKPYSSARDEYKGVAASVFLDANENPFHTPYNRYPDPCQGAVKQKLAEVKRVDPECIFLGNGSDEAIDLLFRAFCEPAVDNVVAISPTYGMYQVCAEINDVEYRAVSLDEQFQCSAATLLAAVDDNTKLIFLCSPNNPTGNDLRTAEIELVLRGFQGLVVVDEAYIDFSEASSWLERLAEFSNLVVLQTFSKAWGCAAIRLGMAFASTSIIAVLNKIKYPYNVNLLTQREALGMLQRWEEKERWVQTLKVERSWLENALRQLSCVMQIFPSDANFLLVRVVDAEDIYQYLVKKGIIVRNRHRIVLCSNCLRITVGTSDENRQLVEALKEYEGCVNP